MNVKVWVGILATAVLLWYSMRNVDFARAWAAAQAINVLVLVPYLALVVAEVLVRAARWLLLLEPVKRCSFRNLSSATLIGLMANNVLPARAGEFVRAYVAARMEGMPFSTSFATVVIDRVFDGLTVSAIFVFALLAYPLPEVAKWSGYLAAAVYTLTLAGLIGLIVREQGTLRLVALLLRVFPQRVRQPVLGWLGAFVGGLGVFGRPGLLAGSIVLSVAIWLGYALSLHLMWLAFDVRLSLLDAFVVLLILTIGLTLPSTPGFLGAMEAAIVTGLGLFGIDPTLAFAIAVVYHVTQYVPITVGGFVALWLERMSFADVASGPSHPPILDGGLSALRSPSADQAAQSDRPPIPPLAHDTE